MHSNRYFLFFEKTDIVIISTNIICLAPFKARPNPSIRHERKA